MIAYVYAKSTAGWRPWESTDIKYMYRVYLEEEEEGIHNRDIELFVNTESPTLSSQNCGEVFSTVALC